MDKEPSRIRTVYIKALKFAPQVYAGMFLWQLALFTIGIIAYNTLDPMQTVIARIHPTLTFTLFFIFIYMAYVGTACIASNRFYQRKMGKRKLLSYWMQRLFFSLAGLTLFVLPALGANLCSFIAQQLTSDLFYVCLALYFVATVLLIWNLFYVPFCIIFLPACLSEPDLNLKDTFCYIKHLVSYNWWHILLSSVGFYFLIFILYDIFSMTYYHHFGRSDFMINLYFTMIIAIFSFPLLTAFYTTLVEDLRQRNFPNPVKKQN